MFGLSVATLLCCAIAYPLNDRPLYGHPLSLLHDGPHGWCYHAVLALLTAIAAVMGRRAFAERRWGELAMLAMIVGLLATMQVVTSAHGPTHDRIAHAAMGLFVLYGLVLALRRGCLLLSALAALLLFSLPSIGSANLAAIGYGENLLIAVALAIVNCVHRGTPPIPPPPWLRAALPQADPGGGGVRAAAFLAAGCVIVCLIVGGFRTVWLGGPLLTVMCWLGGFVAWRYQLGAVLRMVVLVGTVYVSLTAGSALGVLEPGMSMLVVAAMPVWMVGGVLALREGWLDD